jgi:hypothetical protein
MARNLSIRTEPPEVLPDERLHGCYEGWVYLGFEGEDEHGEPVEVMERVPCRRCQTVAAAKPCSPGRIPVPTMTRTRGATGIPA